MSNSNKTAKEALHYYKDRTGQKYGRLLAIKYLYTNKRKKQFGCVNASVVNT